MTKTKRHGIIKFIWELVINISPYEIRRICLSHTIFSIGLNLVFWALIGTMATGTWRILLATLFGSDWKGGAGGAATTVGGGLNFVLQLVMTVFTIVSFVGRVFCLWVPQGTGTKLRIIAAITAVSGYKDGNEIVKLIEKIKFAKPRR